MKRLFDWALDRPHRIEIIIYIVLLSFMAYLAIDSYPQWKPIDPNPGSIPTSVLQEEVMDDLWQGEAS